MTLVELNLVLTFGLVESVACRRLHRKVAALLEHVQAPDRASHAEDGTEICFSAPSKKEKGRAGK